MSEGTEYIWNMISNVFNFANIYNNSNSIIDFSAYVIVFMIALVSLVFSLISIRFVIRNATIRLYVLRALRAYPFILSVSFESLYREKYNGKINGILNVRFNISDPKEINNHIECIKYLLDASVKFFDKSQISHSELFFSSIRNSYEIKMIYVSIAVLIEVIQSIDMINSINENVVAEINRRNHESINSLNGRFGRLTSTLYLSFKFGAEGNDRVIGLFARWVYFEIVLRCADLYSEIGYSVREVDELLQRS
jgi:hypothetical protein